MHMYQPPQPHIPEPPTKKVQLLAGLSFGGMALLAIAVAILSFQLVTQYHRTSDQANNASQLAAALSKTKDELTLAQRQLIIQSQLPAYDSFPAQCPNGNEKDGLFTPLTNIPIQGYSVFLVDCRGNITTGKSLPRVVVFYTNPNGTKELTYGASDKEPLCISNKIPVANASATSLSLPVCQSN